MLLTDFAGLTERYETLECNTNLSQYDSAKKSLLFQSFAEMKIVWKASELINWFQRASFPDFSLTYVLCMQQKWEALDAAAEFKLYIVKTEFLPFIFSLQHSRVKRYLHQSMEENLDAQGMQQCTMIQSVSSRVMMAI